MQDEVNTKVVAIMIKGGKISAEVLKKARWTSSFKEIEKAQKQMQQLKTYRGKQSIKHLRWPGAPLAVYLKGKNARNTATNGVRLCPLWCIILTVRKTMWTQEVCT